MDLDVVAPFNSNFDNKTLCESGVMWIIRFVTYLSIAFHIYLLIIIHFELIKNYRAKPPVKRKQTEHVFCCWSYLSKTTWRQSENTAMTRWRNEVGGIKNYSNINQKCYFLLWLFHLRWTLIQHFQVFHVNKPNTYLSKTTWRQSENTAMTRWRNEVGGIS
jgi:hypothetical protein